MSEIHKILTEYFDSMYYLVKPLSEDSTVQLVKSNMDEKLYVCKYEEHYDIKVYKKLKKLNIDGIPKIFELLESESGLVVIEEYIEGTNLANIGNVPFEDKEGWIIHIGLQICDILSSLHRLTPPIIHRDLKPQNIIVNNTDVYLVDYNISREYSGEQKKDTFLMGTKDYAAPEQYGFAESDVRTDVYGLGATLKFLVETYNVESDKLQAVVSKAMAFDPSNRYQSVEGMKLALKSKGGKSVRSFFKKYALPGFRSGNFLYMLIASAVYIFLIYILTGFKMGNNNFEGSKALLFDFFGGLYIFINAFFIIFFTCDYLGMRCQLFKKLKIRTNNKLVKLLFIILVNSLFVILTLVIYITLMILVFGAKNITG